MIHVNPEGIVNVVSRVTDVSVEKLRSKDRFRHISRARLAAYYVMREHGYSYPVIGQSLNRDHTSALSGFKKARQLVYTDAHFNHVIQVIQRSIHLAKETPMAAPPTLEEFITRCAQRVDGIQNTKDEGVFAKQYEEDVTILLRLIRNKNESLDSLYQRSV